MKLAYLLSLPAAAGRTAQRTYAKNRILKIKIFSDQDLKVFLKAFQMPFAEFNLVKSLQSYSHFKMAIFAKIAWMRILHEQKFFLNFQNQCFLCIFRPEWNGILCFGRLYGGKFTFSIFKSRKSTKFQKCNFKSKSLKQFNLVPNTSISKNIFLIPMTGIIHIFDNISLDIS